MVICSELILSELLGMLKFINHWIHPHPTPPHEVGEHMYGSKFNVYKRVIGEVLIIKFSPFSLVHLFIQYEYLLSICYV